MRGGGKKVRRVTPLGYRGRQVLAVVVSALEAGQRPPSYAMIADRLGMNSIADVCNVVRRLEERGHLKRCDTGSRHRQGWHHPVIVVNNANYQPG